MEKVVILFLITVVPQLCYSDTVRSVEASQFDIAGVKLGMSKSQAISKLTNHFKIKRNTLQFEAFPRKNIITQTKEVSFFWVESGGAKITVHLQPKVPLDQNNPMIVDKISYEMPWTSENEKNMKNMALKKYGTPSNSLNGVIAPNPEWCIEPSPTNIGIGCAMYKSKGSVLQQAGVTLQLSDPRYFQEVIKVMNQSKTGIPSF